MLIATAITLLMMAAVVTLFANLSASISNRRALIELSGQLRQVRQRLARDLAGCTVPPGPGGLMPWRQRPGEAIGYFEIVEGDFSDANPSHLVDGRIDNGEIDYKASLVPSGGDPQSLLPQQFGSARDGYPNDRETDVTNGGALGDYDDILAMTVRALDSPFVAQVPGEGSIESNLAEVLWYAVENPIDDPTTPNVDESLLRQDDPNTPNIDESLRGEPGMRTVYRRVMLIAPWLGQLNDRQASVVSSHVELDSNNNPRRVANTLADLTRREYRFSHEFNPDPTSDQRYPHKIDLNDEGDWLDRQFVVLNLDRQFVVLNNALAWDLRVFDPGAPLYEVTGGLIVEPGDPAWEAAIGGNPPVGFGAYVDLGWDNGPGHIPRYDYTTVAGAPKPLFQQERQLGWHPRFSLPPINDPTLFRGSPAVYDTWSWHYENDGRDQDNRDNDGNVMTGVDEGTNLVDDDGVNGVDDVMERETSPPYPVPLRGVRAILRIYEPDARQIREASVTHSFVP